jgi:aromatic-L-amino-acid/L-tryptophan decarboxylase
VGCRPSRWWLAPALNLICFRVRGASDNLQEAIVMDLQERGLAAPSLVALRGRNVTRAAIVNDPTTIRHADQFALTASRQQRPSRVRRP